MTLGVLVKYHQILIHHAVPSGKRLIGKQFHFQYDNDRKYTAYVVMSYLDRKTCNQTGSVLTSLPQTHGLSILEAVRDHSDRELNKKQPVSKEELWKVLQESWRNVLEGYLKKLQETLRKRVEALLKTKVNHTKQ